MIPNRLTAVALRWSISAAFTLHVFVPNAQAQNAATAIDGVYNGTYTCAIGPRTLKLSLLASGNGSLTGLFTFYLPPTSHTQAFSYSLKGILDAASGKFKLDPVKWEVPPPGSYVMVGLNGAFDPGTGQVTGKVTYGNCGSFQATRDQAESAHIAKAVAPHNATGTGQQHPSTATTTATRGRAPGSSAAVVQNPATTAEGRMPRVPPPPSEPAPTAQASGLWDLSAATSSAMVLVCRDDPPGGLTGLPGPDLAKASGKAAASQPSTAASSLTDGEWIARATQRLQEHAQGHKWGILTQSVTENRICASIYVALPYNADSSDAKAAVASIWELILKLPTPAGLRINSVEVHPPPSAAQVAKAKALADGVAALRAAAPAQLASQGLVRKSKAYWDAYKTDLIRQVFDGGFGSNVDSYTQFRILFDSYAEMFSKSCGASLPAHHEAVTVTQVTTKKDRHGRVVSQEQGQSYTIEVDSRFAPHYRKYHESLTSSGAGLAGALGIMSGRVSANAYFDPGLDMARFFETETCRSAATRQLGENLLRGAEENPSLQQDGATIAGAAAETDRSLPSGRYARFVDGCNGFFRDSANARLRTSHSSPWCDCLGEKYRRLMSRDEEYYYANDFRNRFWSQIAEPRSTDPAWPRLHPAVAECVAEANK